MKIGLFPMVGDLLHTGHLAALEEAKKYCDYLVVALNTQPDNKIPIESVYERAMRLYSCRFVDMILPYSGEKDLELICSTFNYNIRFIGSDHKNWTGKEIEKKRGIEYIVIDRCHDLSSTNLKERIKSQ